MESSNPLMPPAKQQRILIWRSEVASAISSAPAAPSLASSHTSTSLSSSTTPDEPSPSHTTPSRPRSLWKRLSSRFSSKHQKPLSPPLPGNLGDDRTAMYRNDNARLDLSDEGGLPEGSEDGKARGLREKQERLRRAAMLLSKEGF